MSTDLLAACKFALEYLEANEGEYGTEERITACREAIAKAEAASIRTEVFPSLASWKESACEIYIAGLSTNSQERGAIAYVEFYENSWWLRVWADIRKEEATHNIDLSGAEERLFRNGAE